MGPNRFSSLTPDGATAWTTVQRDVHFPTSHVFTLNSFTNDSESSEWNSTCYFETERQEGKDLRTSDRGQVGRGGGRGQSHPEKLHFPVPKPFCTPGLNRAHSPRPAQPRNPPRVAPGGILPAHVRSTGTTVPRLPSPRRLQSLRGRSATEAAKWCGGAAETVGPSRLPLHF